MSVELWCDLPANLSLSKYQISTRGQVGNKQTGYLLSLSESKGYKRISLYQDDGKQKSCLVHRLVALTFIPNPENKSTVNHKNHDRTDNSVCNLEWATVTDQNRHKQKVKTRRYRLINQFTLNRQFVKTWNSKKELKENGLNPNMNNSPNGTVHAEYVFQYADLCVYPGEVFVPMIVEGNTIAVSNMGRYYRFLNGKIRSGITGGNPTAEGYMYCTINKHPYLLHRLTAHAFVVRPSHLENIPHDELVINHKDGNKANNVIDNLEWCTNAENIQHSYDQLSHKNTTPVDQYDLHGNLVARYKSATEAMRSVDGGSKSNIISCCKGDFSTSYGFVWRYKDQPFGQVRPYSTAHWVPVRRIDPNGQIVEYASVTIASEETGAHRSNIVKCCDGEIKTSVGFRWQYV